MRVRLPRVRIRLWWLMVAVAVVGIAAGAVTMWRRRAACLREAAHRGYLLGGLQSEIDFFERELLPTIRARADEVTMEDQRQTLARHERVLLGALPRLRRELADRVRLKRAYEQAAAYPCLPIPPGLPFHDWHSSSDPPPASDAFKPENLKR